MVQNINPISLLHIFSFTKFHRISVNIEKFQQTFTNFLIFRENHIVLQNLNFKESNLAPATFYQLAEYFDDSAAKTRFAYYTLCVTK